MGRERFLVDVKVEKSVECSDHEMLEIRPGEKETGKNARSQYWISRVDFGL